MNLQDAFAESKKRSSPMSEHLAPMYHRATGGVTMSCLRLLQWLL